MTVGKGGWRKTVKGASVRELFERIKSTGASRDSLLFVCIGTDRSSGDALGPLTGTLLVESGFSSVIGTLEQPCDAESWEKRMEELRQAMESGERVLIALDACLGTVHTTGMFVIRQGPLEAGRSMKLGLPPIGMYSIAGVVNENRANPYTVLQTTPLSRVLTMARQVASAFAEVYPPQ